DVEAFRRGPRDTSTFCEVLSLTISALERAVEFPRREHRVAIAAWNVGTYFHRMFLSFPRLSLSGERESGKSKVLTLLGAMSWNGMLMLNPTPAVLFRLVQEFRPTLLLDEIEDFGQEDRKDILSIINSGYKKGATVPRCEGKEVRRVEKFDVYSPLAMAGI